MEFQNKTEAQQFLNSWKMQVRKAAFDTAVAQRVEQGMAYDKAVEETDKLALAEIMHGGDF